VFFSRDDARVVLSDVNARLVATYIAVRDRVEEVISRLATLDDTRLAFEHQRQAVSDGLSGIDLGVAMIFMNKTGFNGPYRENRRGHFNVPYADERQGTRQICDAKLLRHCAKQPQSRDVRCSDFESVLDAAKPGDAVYADPPYIPLTQTSFTVYASGGFHG